MKTTITTCDVDGCREDGYKEVECCHGWVVSDNGRRFKKLEKPLNAEKTDLCKKHYKEWAKITCKLLKMDVEKDE